MSVTIVDVAAVLNSIAVSGPSSVNESSTATYTATGTWDNGTTAAISADVERVPDDVRLDQHGRRSDDAGGDGEPVGDGDGELRRQRPRR